MIGDYDKDYFNYICEYNDTIGLMKNVSYAM